MRRASALLLLVLSAAALAVPERKSREELIDHATKFKGTPYVWAGTSKKGFDCSGYIYAMMRDSGYEVPRMADEQFEATQRVERKDLKRGDLVFFTTYMPGPSHVGIYLGEGRFIHASSAGGGVIVSQMNDGYYSKAFIGGGRPDGYPAPDGQAVAVAPSPEEPRLMNPPKPEPAPPIVLKEPDQPPTMVAAPPAPTPEPVQATLPEDLAAPRGLQLNWALLGEAWQLLTNLFSPEATPTGS